MAAACENPLQPPQRRARAVNGGNVSRRLRTPSFALPLAKNASTPTSSFASKVPNSEREAEGRPVASEKEPLMAWSLPTGATRQQLRGQTVSHSLPETCVRSFGSRAPAQRSQSPGSDSPTNGSSVGSSIRTSLGRLWRPANPQMPKSESLLSRTRRAAAAAAAKVAAAPSVPPAGNTRFKVRGAVNDNKAGRDGEPDDVTLRRLPLLRPEPPKRLQAATQPQPPSPSGFRPESASFQAARRRSREEDFPSDEDILLEVFCLAKGDAHAPPFRPCPPPPPSRPPSACI